MHTENYFLQSDVYTTPPMAITHQQQQQNIVQKDILLTTAPDCQGTNNKPIKGCTQNGEDDKTLKDKSLIYSQFKYFANLQLQYTSVYF